MSEELRAAVAAGVVGSEATFRSLLESVAEVARAIFGAKASSIFLLDEEADDVEAHSLINQPNINQPNIN